MFELFNIGHFGFDQNHTYPMQIQILGYAITASSIIWIPIFMVIERRKMLVENEANLNSIWLLKPTAVGQNSCFNNFLFKTIDIFLGLGSSKSIRNRNRVSNGK